jgi:hypothetical protein
VVLDHSGPYAEFRADLTAVSNVNGAAPSSPDYAGQLSPQDWANEVNKQAFLVRMILAGQATVAVVQVLVSSNDGAVAAPGTVNVQNMVNQIDRSGLATPRGTIFNLPVMRLQGGANAVIIDPVAGDIGVAVFCHRDISVVKRTKQISNPGSHRQFDWADGIYIGGVLNGAPTQYIQFNSGGATIVSAKNMTLTAPGPGGLTINADVKVNGSVSATAEITANSGASSVTLGSHTHSGVTTGSGDSGAPVPGT